MIGKKLLVMAETFDGNLWQGRSGGESPDVDPVIYFGAGEEILPGSLVWVKIVDSDDYDLYGEQVGLFKEEEK